VAIRLQLAERGLDIEKSLSAGVGLFLSSSVNEASHLPVIEHSREPPALIRERPVPDKAFYKQMKHRVTGCRNRAPHTRCAGLRNSLLSEMPCVIQ
jgi:hypothetical protein